VKLYFTRLWCPVQRKHQRWFCDQPNKRFVGLLIITFYPNAILFLLLNFGIHFDLKLFSQDRLFALHLNPSFWISSLHITFFSMASSCLFLFLFLAIRTDNRSFAGRVTLHGGCVGLLGIQIGAEFDCVGLPGTVTLRRQRGNSATVIQGYFNTFFFYKGPKGRAQIWPQIHLILE